MISDGGHGFVGFAGRPRPSPARSCELFRVGVACMSDISSGCPAPTLVAEVAGQFPPVAGRDMSAPAENDDVVDCAIVGESDGAANTGEVTSGWTKRY